MAAKIQAAMVLALVLAAGPAGGDEAGTAQPAIEPANLPHIHVDRQQRLIDLDATVIGRPVDWLELLACIPKSREHEAILTVAARPSHVHLALMMIGLEPGSPMRWERVGDQIVTYKSHGPRIAVTILVEQAGRVVEVPANQWIMDKQTKQPMGDNVWLFTGSRFEELEGQSIYVADLDGNVLSIVNFGNDVLVKETDTTNMTDQEAWTTMPDAIPPAGTNVRIRLRPLNDDANDDAAEE